jgi:hypothetical protein
VQARQAAHQAYAEAGDERRAAVVALGLFTNFAVRATFSVAAGWLARTRRHLEAMPVGREHALLVAMVLRHRRTRVRSRCLHFS